MITSDDDFALEQIVNAISASDDRSALALVLSAVSAFAAIASFLVAYRSLRHAAFAKREAFVERYADKLEALESALVTAIFQGDREQFGYVLVGVQLIAARIKQDFGWERSKLNMRWRAYRVFVSADDNLVQGPIIWEANSCEDKLARLRAELIDQLRHEVGSRQARPWIK